jgi:isoleucyl-tRNA synthetase
MECLLEIVYLGSAARNNAKVKVRQPLQTMRIAPSQDSYALTHAINRFRDQIMQELNIKSIEIHDETERPMLNRKVSLKRSAFAKLGAKGKEAAALLASLPDDQLGVYFTTNTPVILGVELADEDFERGHLPPEGWFFAESRRAQVMIDVRITPELKAEGLSRDVIRLVQDERKKAGLDVADKIALFLGTESAELKAAIVTHRDTIAADTQAIEWSETPLPGAHAANVKVDGQALMIGLRKSS